MNEVAKEGEEKEEKGIQRKNNMLRVKEQEKVENTTTEIGGRKKEKQG